MPHRLYLLLVSLLLTSGCSGAAFWLANAKSDLPAERIVSDLAYGQKKTQKLDIYLPVKSARPHDVIVFLYGGRWETGAKKDYAFVADAFTRRGYIVVIPDYRKYPDVKFPVFAQDAAASIAWTAQNIGEYGGNKARLFVSGHSAGAHLGALVVADETYLSGKKLIRGFAGLAGPYSFTPDEKDLIDMFGPPRRYPQMQVTTFIDGAEPPMLLLHGAKDTTVERYNLDRLKAAIEKHGGKVKTKIYPGLDHIGIAAALSWLKRDEAPVIDDIDAFFKGVK